MKHQFFSSPHSTHQSSMATDSGHQGAEQVALEHVIVPDISTSLHILRGLKTSMRGVSIVCFQPNLFDFKKNLSYFMTELQLVGGGALRIIQR